MPVGGVNLIGHKEILSFEEIYNVVSVGTILGIDKVRITGGEPLVSSLFIGQFKADKAEWDS